MDFRIAGLPSFRVLGLLAHGPACEAPGWVPRLWGQVLSRRAELDLPLGECWGLMGTPGSPLSPWGETGSYLAGWEIPRHLSPPEGWSAWDVPASAWIRVAVTAAEIPAGHEFLRDWLAREAVWAPGGACHEHYPATFRDPEVDRLHLCLPIRPA